MRPFTKLFVLALACVLNAASAHASGSHAIPSDKRDMFLKALRAQSEQGHARKLLAGLACAQHAASPNANGFVAVKCAALHVKDEGHFCDTADLLDAAEDILDYDIDDDYADMFPDTCIADSVDDCCKPNDGAIAGVVVGGFVGIVGIITLFAFCCKCCCFRPKQILVMQQQPAVAMQQQPQVVVVPAGAR
jgi:hypothetical protein